MKLKVDISNRTVIRVLGLVLLFVLGVQFVISTAPALVLIFIGFFLAVALNPAVEFFQRQLPFGGRGAAVAVTFVLGFGLLGLLMSTIIPPLVEQTQALIDNFPQYLEDFTREDGYVARLANEYNLIERIQASQSQIVNQLTSAGEPLFNVLGRVSASVISVVTVLVLTFFMLLESKSWLEKFWQLQPKASRAHRQELAGRMYQAVTGYVNGQVAIAFVSGVAAFVMMIVLGIPFAVPLAAIVAVFALIPLIGSTIGASVAVVVALFQSVTAAVILVIFFVVYQQIENNIVQPLIQARSVEMTPLGIMMAAIIGVALAGLLGALIAIPVAACIRIVFNDYVQQHQLAKE